MTGPGGTTLIVHEWLTNNAGSERVVAEMRNIFPGSQVATTMRCGPDFADWDVITTSLQRLARGPDSHVSCLPLMAAAWQMSRLPEVDRVVTSFHTFALWARVPDETEHIVYCHTPPRFLWARDQIKARGSGALSAATWVMGGMLRYLDRRRAAGRPVRWIANSQFTAAAMKRAYGADAEVIYPPVDTAAFADAAGAPKGDHYLVLGRVVPYKRVGLAIEAFRILGLPLVVAGTGRELAGLKAGAPANVRFLGSLPEADKAPLLAGARALVFPGLEDFGIVPVEAAAAGTPVIAYGAGGVAETVAALGCGYLFDQQDPQSLAAAVRRYEDRPTPTPSALRCTELYGRERFARQMRQLCGPTGLDIRGTRDLGGAARSGQLHQADNAAPVRASR